jgi:hypothetical protein
MNWKEMHIGIDLGLQELNSNLYNKLQPQAKDYYLNRVLMDLILGEGRDSTGRDNIPILTADELRNKYIFLEPFLTTLELDLVRGSKFDYGLVPKGFTDDITSGFLQSGVEYLVVTAGDSPFSLTSFGGENIQNSKFTCDIDNIESSFEITWNLAVQVGGIYEIVAPGSFDFTTIGAENSMIGTRFVSTHANVLVGEENIEVSAIKHAPAWGTSGAILKALTPLDVLMYYSSHSVVDVGYSFNSGKLIKGVSYRIVEGGTITNFTDYGADYNTVEEDYIFTCIKSGVPNWGSSGVYLIETREFPNVLTDYKELESALDHSFGSSVDSPICCLVNGQLRVYHQTKFKLNKVSFDYIRTPVKIDSINNINSDLNVGVHGYLVDRTVQRIVGHRGQQQYQTVRAENEEIK